jgi:hypothetical protein
MQMQKLGVRGCPIAQLQNSLQVVVAGVGLPLVVVAVRMIHTQALLEKVLVRPKTLYLLLAGVGRLQMRRREGLNTLEVAGSHQQR